MSIMDQSVSDTPPGFEPMRRPDDGPSFVKSCQGMYINHATGEVAARILPEHLNPLGIAHGGFLATLADTALGAWIRVQGKLELPPATAELSIDYISPARPGQWITAKVEIHKLGRTLINASLSLLDGERLVVRAKGILVANTAMHAKTLAERNS
ncbi:Thioesterase superfamily protein [compost metagenome]